MFHELRQQAVNAFKSNQVLRCTYKRRQYLLIDVDTYWQSAQLLRNTPESIANYQANNFVCGDELSLQGFEIEELKVLGLATAP